ncbi:MAG TPA: cobyrinic acid a,c-diamide synthase, partial [Planctomycetaceae bacterium]|nr:cobyrinic acid a,c-diamide synthase [Planctomycetaceae bacterium]
MNIPRLVIAGLRGGGGKTLLSVGLAAAFVQRGLRVAPFKKGPDYIDSAWLALAARAPCRNLDLFLMSEGVVRQSFQCAAAAADLALVEGNRGLFDGVDAQGHYSTAELARVLEAPVILVADATKATRTVAAQVLGCQRLAPQLRLRGVVLNRTAGRRHESVLRESIEHICRIPVMGAVPRLRRALFPERHLGLVPPEEHGRLEEAVRR